MQSRRLCDVTHKKPAAWPLETSCNEMFVTPRLLQPVPVLGSANCQKISFLFFILSQNPSPRTSTCILNCWYRIIAGELYKGNSKDLWVCKCERVGPYAYATHTHTHTHIAQDRALLRTGALSHHGLPGSCAFSWADGGDHCYLRM